MALFSKRLRRVAVLTSALTITAFDHVFAEDETDTTSVLNRISDQHTDCHISLLSIAKTNQTYLPPETNCTTTTQLQHNYNTTTTQLPAGIMIERSTLIDGNLK